MTFDLQQSLLDCGAMLEGHFLLTSGRHSDRYIEKFRLLEQPLALNAAAKAMAATLHEEVDVVLGAAVGGILLVGAMSRILGRRSMFTERVEGKMTLRRGFMLKPGEKVVIVEDIVSTGGSIDELIEIVTATGAETVAALGLVDRSAEGYNCPIPWRPLLRIPIGSWPADNCKLCQQGVALMEPGRSGRGTG